MLDYLSRPVAFATAPLVPEDPSAKAKARDGSSGSDTDLDDPITKKISRGISLVKAAHSKMLTRYDSSATVSETEAASGPSTFPPPPQPSHAIDLRDDWDDDIRAFEGRSCQLPPAAVVAPRLQSPHDIRAMRSGHATAVLDQGTGVLLGVVQVLRLSHKLYCALPVTTRC